MERKSSELRFDDASLFRRMSSGEEEAFSDFYSRYAKVIFGLMMRVLRDVDLATDATQEFFIQAISNLDRFSRETSEPRGMLLQFAMVIARSFASRESRAESLLDLARTIRSQEMNPDEARELVERNVDLMSLLDRLPPGERAVIEMRLQGMNIEEIAATLSTSSSAVRMRNYRAMHKLRAIIKGELPVEVSDQQRRLLEPIGEALAVEVAEYLKRTKFETDSTGTDRLEPVVVLAGPFDYPEDIASQAVEMNGPDAAVVIDLEEFISESADNGNASSTELGIDKAVQWIQAARGSSTPRKRTNTDIGERPSSNTPVRASYAPRTLPRIAVLDVSFETTSRERSSRFARAGAVLIRKPEGYSGAESNDRTRILNETFQEHRVNFRLDTEQGYYPVAEGVSSEHASSDLNDLPNAELSIVAYFNASLGISSRDLASLIEQTRQSEHRNISA